MAESLTSIIPAAGEATRLRPHSLREQKPMMLMGNPNRRIIDYPLEVARSSDEVFVLTHYDEARSRPLEEYVKSRGEAQILRDWRIMGAASLINFSDALFERDPQGSSVILPADHIIEGLSMQAFHRHHLEHEAEITMLTVPRKPYGQYVRTENEKIAELSSEMSEDSRSSAGIYIITHSTLLEWVRREKRNGWKGETRSLLNDVIHPAVDEGIVITYEMPENGYWDDAGTIGRYYYNNMRLSGGENVISPEAIVSDESTVRRSVVLGGVAINAGAMIEEAVVSGSGLDMQITRVNVNG